MTYLDEVIPSPVSGDSDATDICDWFNDSLVKCRGNSIDLFKVEIDDSRKIEP